MKRVIQGYANASPPALSRACISLPTNLPTYALYSAALCWRIAGPASLLHRQQNMTEITIAAPNIPTNSFLLHHSFVCLFASKRGQGKARLSARTTHSRPTYGVPGVKLYTYLMWLMG